MKHTQGEWVAKDGMIYSESDESGKAIACCNNEANARLIAAAPDLLDACKYTIEKLRGVKGKTFPIMPIIQAITKAEQADEPERTG